VFDGDRQDLQLPDPPRRPSAQRPVDRPGQVVPEQGRAAGKGGPRGHRQMAGDVRGVTVEEATTPAGAPPLGSATRWLDPSRLIWGAAATVLALMVVVPLAWIFVASVHADQDNRFTLANYLEAFTRAI